MFLLTAIAGFILGFIVRQIIGRHQLSFYKHKIGKMVEFIKRVRDINDRLVKEIKQHRKAAKSIEIDEMQVGVIEAIADYAEVYTVEESL